MSVLCCASHNPRPSAHESLRLQKQVYRVSGDVLVVVDQVLDRDIVLRNLPCGHLGSVRIRGVFNALDSIGFEGVSLLCQLLDALGIRLRGVRHLLDVAGLSGRIGAKFIVITPFRSHGFHLAHSDATYKSRDPRKRDRNSEQLFSLRATSSPTTAPDIGNAYFGTRHPRISGYPWFARARACASFSDLLGRRLVFLSGVALFAVASAAYGLALNIHQVIVARSVQGIGAALLVPGSLAAGARH